MCWSVNEYINSSPVQRLQYTLLRVPGIPISPHLHITCSTALCIFQKVIFSQAFYNHSFSNWSCPQTLLDCLCACMLSHFSHIQLFATLWSVAGQEPLSMGFSRQEHCSGLPCPPPGGLPDPGIKTSFLTSPALAGGFFTTR